MTSDQIADTLQDPDACHDDDQQLVNEYYAALHRERTETTMLYKTYGAAQRVYLLMGARRHYLKNTVAELERKENRLLTERPPTWQGTDVEVHLAQIQAELETR